MKKTFQVNQSVLGPVGSLNMSFTVSPNRNVLVKSLFAQSNTVSVATGYSIIDCVLSVVVAAGDGSINLRPTDNLSFVGAAQDENNNLTFKFGRGMNKHEIDLLLEVGFSYTFLNDSIIAVPAGMTLTNLVTLEYDGDYGDFLVELNK
jgi:hypothetical protein